jgi:hypothetical protein
MRGCIESRSRERTARIFLRAGKAFVFMEGPSFLERGEAMATIQTLWGSVEADGTVSNGNSGNFTVVNSGTGEYTITFSFNFNGTPAIVGSQTGFGGTTQDTRDNIVFPTLASNAAIALTGNSNGVKANRSFSFIAIGFQAPVNP